MKRLTILFSVFTVSLIQGCNHSYDEPRPDVFTLENIDRLVVEDILIPEKLDPREKDYKYLTGAADLNGNGSEELLVLMQDPYFCGSGGCTAYLFQDSGELINRMTVTSTPVLLANRETNGWKNFYVWSNGSLRTMAFDGTSYPTNPSVEPDYDRSRELEAARLQIEVQEIFVQDGFDLTLVEQVPIFYPAHTYQFQFKHHGDPQNLYQFTVDMVTGDTQLVTQAVVNDKEESNAQ